jgi:ribosomal protein S16
MVFYVKKKRIGAKNAPKYALVVMKKKQGVLKKNLGKVGNILLSTKYNLNFVYINKNKLFFFQKNSIMVGKKVKKYII